MELYPVVFVLAGIVAMDTTAGPQSLVSEPFVSCSLLGILFGDVETGLTLGTLFQFLWLGHLPLGTVHYTDNNLAAFISTASVLAATDMFGLEGSLVKASYVPAMLLAVPIGYIGLTASTIERRLNNRRSERVISRLERSEPISIIASHLAGIAAAFLKGLVMTTLLLPIGIAAAGSVRMLPEQTADVLSCAAMMAAGPTAAAAVMFYWLKRKHRYLLAGSLFGALWMIFAMV